ncbi:MAG TPA: helix-turn-helix domain-containing protein [Solirubrobacterales bacterium]|nr:helix-turn-helix domain-containing protein [Solirubrobacterales bacterium]
MSEADETLGVEAEALPRLPAGRHGLPRAFVVENQRQRIAAGMIAVVSERGYHEATISDIVAAGGVSRRTFYGYFKTKEECFVETFEIVASFLLETIAEAGGEERSWAGRVRTRLAALLDAFAANPDLARFELGGPPAAGGEIAARAYDFLERLLEALVAGRPKSARRPPRATEQSLAGGLAALVLAKAEAGEGEEMGVLLPDLVELVLTSYLGRERAVAEAEAARG